MKRLHVHVSVDDLEQSRRFYSTLFAAEPTVVKDDYVKWMLADPRVNFAISTRAGRAAGISHLGIQAEDETERSGRRYSCRSAQPAATGGTASDKQPAEHSRGRAVHGHGLCLVEPDRWRPEFHAEPGRAQRHHHGVCFRADRGTAARSVIDHGATDDVVSLRRPLHRRSGD